MVELTPVGEPGERVLAAQTVELTALGLHFGQQRFAFLRHQLQCGGALLHPLLQMRAIVVQGFERARILAVLASTHRE